MSLSIHEKRVFDKAFGIETSRLQMYTAVEAVKALSPKTASQMLLEFHKKFNIPMLPSPCIPLPSRQQLRVELIDEEFKEFKEGIANHDIVEIADALADLIYVIYGAALEFGIPIDKVVEEVHRSNMTKVWPDGTIHRREDGKIMKPPTYSPANINSILYPNGEMKYSNEFTSGSSNRIGEVVQQEPIDPSDQG
jgi:predicted HAD superfamily Cof-like phosphohydrolase